MPALNDELLSHHIATIKRGAGLGNQAEPYMAEMKAIIRKQVAGFDAEKRTAKRLEKLIQTLANKLAIPAGKWRKELEKELKDFALYETKYQTETISGWVNVEMTQPTLTQVWAAAQFQPLALGDTPIDFNKLLDDWGVDEVNRLVMGVKSGFVRGQTVNQIIKEVVGAGGLADISLRNAKTIAQTSIMHVANQARMLTMQENDDVVIGYEWVSTLDSRTSTICRARDGMVFLFTDKFQPKPPAHYNCLSGDTNVSTCGAISNVYKRPYKGRMINVTTKAGRSISITPNHPVLTSSGWIAAGDLDLTCKLVCCNDIGVVVEHQKDNVISKFSDLFSAANVSVEASRISNTPASAEDFHGDISNGKVEVISIDGLSWGKIKSTLSKELANNSLTVGSFADSSLLSLGNFDEPIVRNFHSPDSIVSGLGKCRDLLGCASGHPGKLLLASSPELPVYASEESNDCGLAAIKPEMARYSVSSNTGLVGGSDRRDLLVSESNSLGEGDGNSSSLKDSLDWLFSTAESLPDLVTSEFVDGIELDDVVDLVASEFDGHVYNLENVNNWYLSNGIVTHNCRSSTAPKLSPEFDIFDEGATRASKGADGGKQVSADQSYYGWLKSQPSAFQDEVLGPTRGQIFRNSGLSAEEFRRATVDDLGRPLTLEQMAERDKRVAEYMRNKP